jgi:hypothetical protein
MRPPKLFHEVDGVTWMQAVMFVACGRCKKIFPATEFYRRANGAPTAYCRPCTKKASAEHVANRSEYARQQALARQRIYQRTYYRSRKELATT